MIEPYYDRGGITIYHGDCAEVMNQLGKFDLLLTDPPYGIGEANGKNKSRAKITAVTNYAVSTWDNSTCQTEVEQAIRLTRNAIVFGGNYYQLPPSPCWLVWDKDNGECDFADCELAWSNMNKAVRRIRYRWQGMLQEPGRHKEKRVHPTQKPLAVIRWCLSQCPDVSTVLDPFMGSGTTLLACKLEGISCVGIEREEAYCEAAVKRLAQEVLF